MKKFIRIFLLIAVLLIVSVLSLVAPIDYTPLEKLEEVQHTLQELDEVKIHETESNDTLLAGWSSVNITPRNPINMAGYGLRGPYTEVMDSLYSRAVVFNNGSMEAVIITVDLLLFPGEVKNRVQDSLATFGFSPDAIFLNATHTHSGFGNWEKARAGQWIFGEFDKSNMDFLVSQIVSGVLAAKSNTSPVKIGFKKINANEWVANRLAGTKGTKDPFLRVISLKKENGALGVIVSFAGHPVNLDADIWTLSRDYPGILVDDLEKEDNIDFSMFCAGMVGSHSISSDLPKGPERITFVGRSLGEIVKKGLNSMNYQTFSDMGTLDININMPPSQLRISEGWRLRDWVFRALMEPLQANIKILEIGNILMIGMPCDYSGELSINNQLDDFATERGKELFITSFNGNYVGYITEDSHYLTCDKSEVRAMNWVGPFKGKYFTSAIKKIVEAASK